MKKSFIYIILITIFFSFFTSGFYNISYCIENTISAQSDIKNLDVYSDCVLMIEKDTGEVIYEKNSDVKMYPASTTKMLTAILVLEKCNLDDTVTVNSSALNSIPDTYVTSELKNGEKFRVEDLLHALLIPSANDAANVLAEHISGSIPEFSSLMNKKAKEIGCSSSNFTNPSGIHDENLYTTAYDLALIAKYAMKINKFREIVSTTNYTLPSTEVYTKTDRSFVNTNFLINPNDKNYYYEYATGIKTGYTNPAKDCLVASAKKDDIEFIVVILGSDSLENGIRKKYLDCKTLFDFAFDNYITHFKELQQQKSKVFDLSFLGLDLAENTNTTSIKYFYIKILIFVVAVVLIFISFIMIFKFNKNKKF